MSERTVRYVFTGNFTGLTAGLAASGKSVADFGTKLTALDAKGTKMRAGLSTLGSSAGKLGIVAGAGIAVMIGAAARFDKAMSSVQAATMETAGNMELLRAAAIRAGADTAFSATEAAQGIEAMAKAGVSTADILSGGLTSALNLAAAGSLDVGQAAEIAATTMTQFGLAGTDVGRIADTLAAAAGKAQGEVTDMAGALKYVGPVAAQMGLSLEETTGAIAELASQGVLGEQAGTSLRGMLTSLTSPSKVAKEQMDALGISMYDASGNFIGLDGIAGQLKATMGDLGNAERDAALGRIFGNEQITAARILYAGGAEAVQSWTDKVTDSGFAAEQAATKMDNLAGDFEQLKGSLETALIGAGEGSQGPLRRLVQTSTELVNALSDLPGPAKDVSTGLLAITAVTGGSLWFGSKVVGGIASTRLALVSLGIAADTTAVSLGVVAATAGVVATAAFAGLNALDIQDTFHRSSEAADAATGSIEQLTQALSNSNVGKYADDLDIDLARLAADLQKNGEQGAYVSAVMDRLGESSHGAGAAVNALATRLTLGHSGLLGMEDTAESSSAALNDLREVATNLSESSVFEIMDDFTGGALFATAATKQFIGPTRESADALKDETQALRDSIVAMRDKRDATLGAFNAETQWGQAVMAARLAAAKGKRGIDELTEAGQENRSALSGLASAWNNQSGAVQNADGKFKNARKTFIDTATAMGVPQKAAERLANTMLEMPSQKLIEVKAKTDAAQAELERIQNFKLLDKFLTVHTLHDDGTGVSWQHGATGAAAGGHITSSGGPMVPPAYLQEIAA